MILSKNIGDVKILCRLISQEFIRTCILISSYHMISRINGRFMSVNEKSEKVLEQYDIGIRRMVRGTWGDYSADRSGL